ncbi:hypothetical protein F66182_3442 [Fusarium sp. NRRL 66182]|nr:hypothetical protein F66182_3442 [Fusarium sp. NRRL 66182]
MIKFYMFCFLFLLLFVPSCATTNMDHTLESADESPRHACTVFLIKGADIRKTVDFIKSTVESEDVQPCKEGDDESMLWIVKASSSQVAKLKEDQNIGRVVDHVKESKRRHAQYAKGMYSIYPIDKEDQQQCIATDDSLRAFLNDRLERGRYPEHIIDGWVAKNLTLEEVSDIVKMDGVKVVVPVHRGRRGAVRRPHRTPSAAPKLPEPLQKQHVKYETQTNAAPELIAISQPRQVESFSHRSDRKKEFANVAEQHLLTQAAIDNNDEPWVDDDNDYDSDNDGHGDDDENHNESHGTCGAGKALGTQFGSSKGATLVVVRLHELVSTELYQALGLIITNIDQNPERRKKSVVTMSVTFGNDWDDDDIQKIKSRFEELFARDVPFVTIADNIYSEKDSKEVDAYPSVMEGPDLPLIVVGSVNRAGEMSEFSKAGPHVNIWAVGEEVLCLPKEEGRKPMLVDGTSYAFSAAPLVAGEIANILSYETVPFDTSDGNLVKNLKAYLLSDKGSWERVPGIRVLWNGVTEEYNPREKVVCSGLERNLYVERDDVKGIIENDFCPVVLGQHVSQQHSSPISRIYNQDTPNMVTLSVDFGAGLSIKQSKEDCIKYLMMVVDGCDFDKETNPANYKGGGTTKRGRHSIQRISCTYKVLFNEYWVWGHGWASSDSGQYLKKRVEACAPFPPWKFEYGLGDDGREWSANFRSGVGQKRCVSHAIGTAAGLGDFDCEGSGT